MVTPTLVNPEGIWMLGSVYKIMDMAGFHYDIEHGCVHAVLHKIVPHMRNEDGDLSLHEAIEKKMCPIVQASMSGEHHAMVAVEIYYPGTEDAKECVYKLLRSYLYIGISNYKLFFYLMYFFMYVFF